MAKKKAAAKTTKKAAATVLVAPGKGRTPAAGERRVFLTNHGEGVELQLAGNTLKVPSGEIEVRSDSPDLTPIQVARHIEGVLLKHSGCAIEERE